MASRESMESVGSSAPFIKKDTPHRPPPPPNADVNISVSLHTKEVPMETIILQARALAIPLGFTTAIFSSLHLWGDITEARAAFVWIIFAWNAICVLVNLRTSSPSLGYQISFVSGAGRQTTLIGPSEEDGGKRPSRRCFLFHPIVFDILMTHGYITLNILNTIRDRINTATVLGYLFIVLEIFIICCTFFGGHFSIKKIDRRQHGEYAIRLSQDQGYTNTV